MSSCLSPDTGVAKGDKKSTISITSEECPQGRYDVEIEVFKGDITKSITPTSSSYKFYQNQLLMQPFIINTPETGIFSVQVRVEGVECSDCCRSRGSCRSSGKPIMTGIYVNGAGSPPNPISIPVKIQRCKCC